MNRVPQISRNDHNKCSKRVHVIYLTICFAAAGIAFGLGYRHAQARIRHSAMKSYMSGYMDCVRQYRADRSRLRRMPAPCVTLPEVGECTRRTPR